MAHKARIDLSKLEDELKERYAARWEELQKVKGNALKSMLQNKLEAEAVATTTIKLRFKNLLHVNEQRLGILYLEELETKRNASQAVAVAQQQHQHQQVHHQQVHHQQHVQPFQLEAQLPHHPPHFAYSQQEAQPFAKGWADFATGYLGAALPPGLRQADEHQAQAYANVQRPNENSYDAYASGAFDQQAHQAFVAEAHHQRQQRENSRSAAVHVSDADDGYPDEGECEADDEDDEGMKSNDRGAHAHKLEDGVPDCFCARPLRGQKNKITLGCGDVMHKTCLDNWLSVNKKADKTKPYVCPVCQKALPEGYAPAPTPVRPRPPSGHASRDSIWQQPDLYKDVLYKAIECKMFRGPQDKVVGIRIHEELSTYITQVKDTTPENITQGIHRLIDRLETETTRRKRRQQEGSEGEQEEELPDEIEHALMQLLNDRKNKKSAKQEEKRMKEGKGAALVEHGQNARDAAMESMSPINKSKNKRQRGAHATTMPTVVAGIKEMMGVFKEVNEATGRRMDEMLNHRKEEAAKKDDRHEERMQEKAEERKERAQARNDAQERRKARDMDRQRREEKRLADQKQRREEREMREMEKNAIEEKEKRDQKEMMNMKRAEHEARMARLRESST